MAKTLSNLNDLKSRTNRTLNATDRYEYSAIFLEARMQFKLVSNIRTLMQIVEQMGLATSLESLNVDVYCLYDIHIFDSNEVLQIGSLSVFLRAIIRGRRGIFVSFCRHRHCIEC